MCNINYKAVLFDFYHDDEVAAGLMDAIKKIDPNAKYILVCNRSEFFKKLDSYFKRIGKNKKHIIHFLGHGTKSGIKITTCIRADEKSKFISKLKEYFNGIPDHIESKRTMQFEKKDSRFKIKFLESENHEYPNEHITWEEIGTHIPVDRSNFIFNFTCCYSAYGIKMAEFLTNFDFDFVGYNGRINPRLSISFQELFYKELKKRNDVAEAVKVASILILKKYACMPSEEYYDEILGVYFHSRDYSRYNDDVDNDFIEQFNQHCSNNQQ